MSNKKTVMRIVADQDGKLGCPVIRWDGPYPYRCSLGLNKCSIHGSFKTKTITVEK